MLLYANRSFFRVVLQASGSIFFALPNLALGIVLAALAMGAQHLADIESVLAPFFASFYVINAINMFIGWAVVHRMNLAWTRYWEGLSQLHTMYSKWLDSFTMIVAFAEVSIARAERPESRTAASLSKA